jgi:DNA repair exonuclease SbcCD ATPase subunit
MLVKEITLRNFRRFRRTSITLDEGINVVKGPNESGKSTLVQALLAAFYWKVDATRKEVRDSVTWGERDGFVLEVEGEAAGQPFRLVKDFSSKRASLSWGGNETSDTVEIEERIKEWLGLGSEVAYRSTAGIRQDEVAVIGAGRKELSESLQATVTGSEGGKGALEAANSLNREATELLRGKRGPAKNPGPLARVDEEIAEWQTKWVEIAQVVEDRKEARSRLERIDTEAGDIEEDIEDFHRRYSQLESAAALIQEDERLGHDEQTKYGSLKRILEGKRDELGELELRRAGIQEGLNIMRGRLEEARKAHYRVWAPYALVAGITLVLVGLAGTALSLYMLFAALAGAALVAVSLFAGGYLVFLRRGREYKSLQEQVEELEARERKFSDEAQSLISEAGVDSVESFTELKLGYLELLARRKEIADKLEVLVPEGDLASMEEEARQLATEVSMRDRRLKELRGRTVDAVRLQELLREKDRLRSRLDALYEERIRLGVVMSEEGVEEELLRAEEELQYLRERRTRLQRRADALELAQAWLERASSETLSSAARRLEEMIGTYISRITDRRYYKVRVDEGTFDILVWSEEKGGDVEPGLLSRGTVDQIYLAARLSLVQIICGEDLPPLLLDDPFVTFDSSRLEKAMGVLDDFAAAQQVIIFTCGDHYDAYAHNLVELG